MLYWPYLYIEICDVRPSATKTDFFRKIRRSKNALFCQCGSDRIHFHWPNLFSLVKSILWYIWCRSKWHKNWFFPKKIPRSKKALFVNVGVAESIFAGQILFHCPNLFSLVESILGIYGVPPSATKIDFFSEKSLALKRLCLSMWEWPNLFSVVKSIFVGQKRLCL